MKSDFMVALKQLAAERHLPMEQVLGAIELALASAFKKDNPASGQNISVTLNPNSGEVSVYALKTVVEDVEDDEREITLTDARHIRRDVGLGDEVAAAEPLPHNASRIAAQTAKQVVLQRLREAERELLFQEFAQHEGDIMSGIVETSDSGRSITLDLGRAQAILPPDEQVTTERYRKGQRVKVFILSVRSAPKGPEILVSRSHRNMLRRLFEIEVPEVHNGVVDIKAIAREAGFRSKVAVSATQPGIDPVGSCIGIRGNRIQSIVNELQGEKIDIVSWDSDPRSFIANALSPSEPVQVELLDAEQTAVVVVPDRQLSLAIGKEGQNTRLAARLTGWRLDIKGMTEWEQIREARLQAAAEAAAAKAAAVAVARAANGTAQDEASSEPEEVETLTPVAEVVAAIEQGLDIGEPTAAVDGAVPEPAVDAVAGDLDDDSILEALILDEELLTETVAEVEPAVEAVDVGLSVDDLDTFTLDDMEILDEEDGEEENLPLDLGELPILTPDAGKIRFAEDIVEDIRGGGRRGGGRARRGGGGGSRRR
jgi:N utilization substance protein A